MGGAAAGVAAILTAAGSIVSARASRGKARRDELDQVRTDRDRLRAERDTAVAYVYDLREVLHAADLKPPPWPEHARPPWEIGGPP